MFHELDMAPPDAILGLTDAFRADPNPRKINLSVGVYQDAEGRTPILASVRQAAERMLASDDNAGYLGIQGAPEYGRCVQALLFGGEHEVVASGRAETAQSPGGTGALRVAADFIHQKYPQATVWLSEPTWPNHPAIFQAAGVPIKTYPYFDAKQNRLAIEQMLAALSQVATGDVVLLHACCHNPTGVDPSSDEWKQLADLLADKRALPLLDFAYQGFGRGLEQDAHGLRELARPGSELLVASSFSKNFGLYKQRVGALTVVAADGEDAAKSMSHIKRAIRTSYSNPPAFGGGIVSTILADEALRTEWEQELASMRDRINNMRSLFVQTLAAKGVKRDFSFLTDQLGMFSFSGLTREQVDRLRDEHAIYIVGSGRINVAGMTPKNMEPLCEAIAGVLQL